jgi:hypothetical protein
MKLNNMNLPQLKARYQHPDLFDRLDDRECATDPRIRWIALHCRISLATAATLFVNAGFASREDRQMSDIHSINAAINGGDMVTVRGRAAWALLKLIASGESGCSYVDHPAPRWGGYVHKLRKLGIIIDTIREAHGGPFAGHHARYCLQSRVSVVEQTGR